MPMPRRLLKDGPNRLQGSSGFDHFILGGLNLFFNRFGLTSSGYFLALLSIILLRVDFLVFPDGFGRLPV